MDSVYDAALAHAEKLKAELATLQNFLDLHEHFRDHFGLTPSPTTSTAVTPEAEAPVAEQSAATPEAPAEEPAAEVEDTIEAQTPEAEAPEAEVVEAAASEPESDEPESDELEPSALAASEPEAAKPVSAEPVSAEPVAAEPETSLHAAPDAEASTPSEAGASEEKPRVIQASEGVLIAATSETAATEPLGPEATLQTVAEKLAATISAVHPTVTGYTV